MRLGLRDLQRAKLKFALLGGALALLVFLLLFVSTLSTTLLGFFTGAVKHNSAEVLVYNSDARGATCRRVAFRRGRWSECGPCRVSSPPGRSGTPP